MKPRLSEVFTFLIIVAAALIGWYIYPALPERLASHWNAAGQVNGYMSKFWGVFIMPIISFFLWLVFLVIPRIDPKKDNIAKFRKVFDVFVMVIFLFLFYLFILTLIWNVGLEFNLLLALAPVFAVLFLVSGYLIGHAEPNWTIGIRTPWTLSSETVWRKTHHLGKWLFSLCAIPAFLGIWFSSVAIWLIVVPIIAVALFLFVYSYFLYRAEKK